MKWGGRLINKSSSNVPFCIINSKQTNSKHADRRKNTNACFYLVTAAEEFEFVLEELIDLRKRQLLHRRALDGHNNQSDVAVWRLLGAAGALRGGVL